MVVIATTIYCSVVDRIPEHIPVIIFVSSRVDSLMFARCSVFPREELCCTIELCMSETLSLFLGADVSDN